MFESLTNDIYLDAVNTGETGVDPSFVIGYGPTPRDHRRADQQTVMCKCGCGQEVPIQACNHWCSTKPYWAWVCTKHGCRWYQQEWRNQTGICECSCCGRPREFVGHFVPGGKRGLRVTVTGEEVRHRRLDSLFWKGAGALEGGTSVRRLNEAVSIPSSNRS